MRNVNFLPRYVQRILSSHKISEKYDEQEVFYKKTVINNFTMFTGKHVCWSLFFNRNTGLEACNFIKKRLQHRCFLDYAAKFCTAILKNICDVFLHEEDVESESERIHSAYKVKKTFLQKQNKIYHSKTQLDEKKNLPFQDVLYHLVFLYFITAFTLHNI